MARRRVVVLCGIGVRCLECLLSAPGAASPVDPALRRSPCPAVFWPLVAPSVAVFARDGLAPSSLRSPLSAAPASRPVGPLPGPRVLAPSLPRSLAARLVRSSCPVPPVLPPAGPGGSPRPLPGSRPRPPAGLPFPRPLARGPAPRCLRSVPPRGFCLPSPPCLRIVSPFFNAFFFFCVHRFPVVERIRFGVSAALGACHGPVLLLPAACCCVARLCLLCHALSRAVPGFCLRAQPAWPWWLLRSSWSYGSPRAGGPRGFGCPAPPASPPGVPRRACPPTPSPPSRCSLRALTVPSPFAVARLACRRRWVGLLPVGGVRAGWLCLAAGWLVCLARGLALGCRSRVWPCVVLACRVSRPVLLPPCPGLGPARLWWALVLPV